MTSPSVVIADHRGLLREALADALRREGIDVLAAAPDCDSALLQLDRTSPGVLVVEPAMPGALDLLVPTVRSRDERPRILVLDRAVAASDAELLRAIEAGADGYTTGRGGIAGLADAVRAIAAGRTVVPPDMLGPLLHGLIEQRRASSAAFERLMQLTPREREILLLVADGLDHDDIAEQLFISAETARTHVHRVLRKLDVGSRLEAVTLVRRHGLADHLERVVERAAG